MAGKIGDILARECLPVEDTLCQLTDWIYKIIPPSLLVVSTIGNIFNIALLSRITFRYKPVFVLLFLSLSDMVYLWTVIPRHMLINVLGFDYLLTSQTLCKIISWLSVSSASVSVWIVSIVTVERLVVVLFSSQRVPLTRRNKTLGALFGITCMICTMSGGLVFADSNHSEGNGTMQEGDLIQANTSSCTVVSIDFGSFTPIVALVVVAVWALIPVVIILVGNVILLHKLAKRNELFGQSTDSQTKILAMLTGLMLVTIGPHAMLVFFVAIFVDTADDVSPSLALVKSITQCFFYCNYSFNYLCYFWSGTLFKNEVKSMWRGMRTFCRRRSSNDNPQTPRIKPEN